MASDFLKNMARQQAEKADAEFGANAYGGSNWRAQQLQGRAGTPTANAAPAGAPGRKSSSFLQQQASQARQRIDAEYGADAYGGSNYQFGKAQTSAPSFTQTSKPAVEPVQWQDVGTAQTEMESWANELTGMYSQIEEKRSAAERYSEQLKSAYDEIQRLQADSRLGSDPIVTGSYQNAVTRYNSLLPTYQAAAEEHDSLVEQYNTMLARYESGYDAYTELLAGQGDRAAELRAQADTLEEENRELSNLIQMQTVGLSRAEPYGIPQSMRDKLAADQATYAENETKITQLREQAAQAEAYYYATIPMQDDYAQYSAAGPAKREADDLNAWKFWQERGDDLYDFINDLKLDESDELGYRQTVELLSLMANQQDKYGAYTPYSYMTEDEIGIYNYLYATGGKAAADDFLAELMNTLNYRMGVEGYENLTGVGKALYWIPAGIDQFASGIGQLFSEEALPTSDIQFTSGMVSQEAHDASPVLGFAYDLGTTVSNMAPSILLSYVSAGLLGSAGVAAGTAGKIAGGIGSATLGASAGGNAYTQKINEGYTPEQARQYATLIGASEATLQYVLGGIGNLGGISAEKVAVKIAGIDNALARIALNMGVKMTSEGLEEGLQEILAPAFETLILGEEFEVNFEDVAYAYLMGALTAGLMEGGGTISAELNRETGFVISDMDGYKAPDGVDYFEGCSTLEEVEAKYYELARQNHPDVGGSQAVMADINRQHDMQKAFYSGRTQAQAGNTQAAPLSLPPLTPTEQTATAQAQTMAPAPAAEIAAQRPVQTQQARQIQQVQPTAEGQELQGLSLPTLEQETVQQQASLPPLTRQPVQQGQTPATPANIQNGGFVNERTAGEVLPDGGRGRLPGTSAGEQTGGMVPGAKRASRAFEQFRAASARQDRINALRGEKVSSRDLGIPQGTETPSVTLVEESSWDDALRSTAQRVYQETGRHVTFVLGSIPIQNRDGSVIRVRGVYTEGGIIIQADNLRVTTDQIADHEIFHDKAFQTPGLIREIEERILERYGAEEFQKVADTYIQKLRGVIDVPAEATPDQIEAAARAILEEIFADAYAGINAFSAHAERFNETVEQTLEDRGAGRGSQNAAAIDRTTGPPADRYSYGGRWANRANLETLNEAEQLEMQNVDAETIRQSTGWFRGADGKWRWEIDDSGMEYSRWGDMNREDRTEYARFRELEGKFIDGTLTEEEQTELRSLIDEGHGHGRAAEQGAQRLSDFIRHEELFHNYPQLRQAGMRFGDLPDGTRGAFDGRDIILDNSMRDAPEDTLIHEIQHAIQKAEGFATGSSPDYWERRMNEEGLSVHQNDRRIQAAEAEYRSIFDNAPEEFKNKVRAINRAVLAKDYDTVMALQDELYESEYADLYSRLDMADFVRRGDRGEELTPADLYRNTAGEIEARDAARRRQWDTQQRQETRPNIGDDNTVFAEDGEWYAAASDPETTSIKEQLAVSQERLNRMDVVASATVPTDLPNKDAAAKWAAERLRTTGYKVDRQGYGEILFSKKDIDKGLRYADTAEEKAALAVLPQVLKRGIEIGGHGQHKGRTKQTITFAAPVELNGTRGNMAVVVNKHGNHYYAHRIVLPDGTAFRFTEEQDNAARELPQGVTVSGSLADATSAASGDSITQNNAESKGQIQDEGPAELSLPTLEEPARYSVDEDSQGRELTPEQTDYFRDSQIRDEAGRLLVMYHGTTEYGEITKFKKGKSGWLGPGIYLTSRQSDAQRYADAMGPGNGAVYDLYANASNPLVVTNSNPVPEILMAIYGRESVYRNRQQKQGNDTHIITTADIKKLQGMGYDGIRWDFGGATELSVFTAEQLKRTDNQTPTSSPDIRFSVDEDADSAQAKEEAEANNKAALEHFGKTYRWAETGYLLLDGSRLDFSGKHEGGPGGYRTVDHRDITDALGEDYGGDDYSGGMIQFMREGNIRIMPESAGINLSVQPTKAQERALDDFISRERGEVILDIDDSNGNTVASVEYPRGTRASKVLNDIRAYFKDGTKPQVSQVAQFRYSVDEQEQRRQTKPVAESLPIIAKRDLKQNLLGLFSIPAGQKAELGTIIDQYADRLLREGALTERDRSALFDRMYESGVMEVEADEYYRMGRDAVRTGRIYVTEAESHEFGDDWSGFRKRAFGAGVYLTSNRADRGVDVWNMELAEMLPGLFDADELDSRSILERIVQVAEEGRNEKVSLAEYTAQLAEQEYIPEDELLDSMERQMDWALRTFAEKAKLEIHLRDRTGIKIAQERERATQTNTRQREREAARRAKERDDRRAMTQRQRENRELRELQQKTLKQLQWLSKNRFRAPEELKSTFDEILGDIDIYAAGAANEMNWSKRYDATWRDLAQMYKEAQKNDPNFLPSKELERIVMRLDGEKIADMDIDALQDLYRAAVGVRTEFYNRNNVINDEMHRLFAEVYTDSKREIETAPGGFKGKGMDRFMNLEQLTPMNVLQRMGGWNPDGAFYSMARQLEQGERDVRAYTVRSNARLEDFLTENEAWVKKADGQGKDAIWYELEVPELLELGMGDKPIFGDTVKVYMTPAQKVHLYLESKNTDNLRHMTGGRTFVDKELYSQGKRTEALAQGRTIRLAPETVKKITSDLTEQERELARVLESYYNDFAKGEINRISNTLYGFDKAQSRNYAPIYTNKNYTKSEIGIFDATAEGVGNLKARQYAANPSYNISAFDAFERHVEQTARFVGMSIPARNWQTLLNWREKNNSTADVITHKWGEEGKRYITEMIERLQGGTDVERDSVSSAADRLLSNYISAIFGANPSIVLKQLGSIPLASVYLDLKNLPSPAQLARIDRGLIGKYTSDLAWRTMGYTTPETKQLKDNPNWTQTNKFTRFTFGGGAITAMDGWAASTLWPWAENKVRRDFPDLEVGTQEQIDAGKSPFYQKVAQVFNEALSRSQSVSDETHQGRLRKSRSPVTRALTMFKSDASQTYNAIRQKIGEARYYARSGADAKTVRRAKRAVGGAFLSAMGGYLWAEAVTFLIAMWKNKGKKYRDEEDELTAESIAQEMAMGLVGDMAGIVVGGEELAEIIGNQITGDTWYGIETPGLEQITDIVELILKEAGNLEKVITGAADIVANDGDLGEYFRDHGNDILGSIKELAAAAATYIPGLPVNNLEAYMLGAVKWISPELATAYEDLLAAPDKSGLSGLTGDALAERMGGLLEHRLGDSNEETAAALAALYEAGHKTAAPSGVPSSFTVNGETRELAAHQQQLYGNVWGGIVADALDELVASPVFAAADAETQAKMVNKLYDYATQRAKSELFDDYEADTWVGKAEAAIAGGESAAEWVAWETLSSGISGFDKLVEAGLEKPTALELATAFDQLEPLEGKKQVSDAQKYRTIDAADLSHQEKIMAIGSIMGTEMTTDTGNPSQYAKMLDAIDSGLTVGDYLTLKEIGGVEEYLEQVEAGVEPQTAVGIVEQVQAIKDEAGEEDVDSIVLYRAAVNAAGSEEEQLAALKSLMSESSYEKVEVSHNFGVPPETYVTFKELLPRYDADGNGSYKQAEVTEAIGSMLGLTSAERATLWQMQGWKPKNNPFDKTVGEQVYQALQAAKAEREAAKEGSAALPQLGATPSLPQLPSLNTEDDELPGLSLPTLDD